MTYYQNQDGELCYTAGTGKPVTGIVFDLSHLATWESHDMFRDITTPDTEPVTYTMSIGYDPLKQRRERSRRVWRKYG